MSKSTIIWFRKGLRVHDNPALLSALEGATHVHPIFILDPWFLKPEKVGVNRIQFLLESLSDLDSSLRKLGSRLFVLRGKPEDVLPSVFDKWTVKRLCFEVDTEPYAQSRDAKVRGLAEKSGVEVRSPVSHTLFDTEWLLHKAGGKAPLTYQSFQKLVESLPAPPAGVEAPGAIPAPSPGALEALKALQGAHYIDVPSLADIGYPPQEHAGVFKGGETAGLERMEAALARKAWVAKFEKPMTAPTDFNPPSTTCLSPYIKFGCVSARVFYRRLQEIYCSTPGSSKPPVSLVGQLLWREFFYTVGYATPNFDRMEGNAICKQVDWDHDPALLAAWESGRTGYPWIDAAMTQLRQQGWLHHLARHAVACFLTRGDLYQHWERGAAVFERELVDADWALNSANWMWLSASAFFAQYFRVYGPVSFGKKYDPDGKYVRHFLPALKAMPKKYIFEPWKAPLEVQRQAKCIIGKDYPAPVVDHDVIHKANISRMAAAYKANKEGNPPKAAAPTGGAPAALSAPETASRKPQPSEAKASGAPAKVKAGARASGVARKRQKTLDEYSPNDSE